MDGTRDVSGKGQEAACLRYADEDLVPREEFIGLYEVCLTTGENLAKVIVDDLRRPNLIGAANTMEQYNGTQVLIQQSFNSPLLANVFL